MAGLDNIDPNDSSEPEVVKQVISQIKSFGDDAKKNYDELRKNYEELKSTVDENSKDVLTQAKLDKLSEDITVRQTALDDNFQKQTKESQERMDQIELALKRPRRGTKEDSISEEEEAKQFAIFNESNKRKSDAGISFEEIKNIEGNIEEYKNYQSAFESYARKYGGSRDRMMPEPSLKALQIGIDPDGGVTVPTAMSNRIIQKLFETDPIRQLASVESITTGAIEWMAETDEAGVEWDGETLGETNDGNETSTPGWRKKKIAVHNLRAKTKITQELLEDSGINIENWLANKVSQKLGRAEAAAFVNGDGIGKPQGFLSYDAGTNWGQVQQVNMGAAGALTADGFVDVKYSLQEYFLERGVWLMNRTTVRDAMKLKTGNGEYIWKPSMMASDPSSSILNLPVRMSTTMPAVAANALSIAIADWKEAYMIVDRLGITVMRDPYTAQPFILFRTRKRVGGGILNHDAIKIGKISA